MARRGTDGTPDPTAAASACLIEKKDPKRRRSAVHPGNRARTRDLQLARGDLPPGSAGKEGVHPPDAPRPGSPAAAARREEKEDAGAKVRRRYLRTLRNLNSPGRTGSRGQAHFGARKLGGFHRGGPPLCPRRKPL